MSSSSTRWWYFSPLFVSWRGLREKLFKLDSSYLLPPSQSNAKLFKVLPLQLVAICLHILCISTIILDLIVTNWFCDRLFPYFTSSIAIGNNVNINICLLVSVFYGAYLILPYLCLCRHLYQFRRNQRFRNYYQLFIKTWFVRTMICIILFCISPTLILYGCVCIAICGNDCTVYDSHTGAFHYIHWYIHSIIIPLGDTRHESSAINRDNSSNGYLNNNDILALNQKISTDFLKRLCYRMVDELIFEYYRHTTRAQPNLYSGDRIQEFLSYMTSMVNYEDINGSLLTLNEEQMHDNEQSWRDGYSGNNKRVWLRTRHSLFFLIFVYMFHLIAYWLLYATGFQRNMRNNSNQFQTIMVIAHCTFALFAGTLIWIHVSFTLPTKHVYLYRWFNRSLITVLQHYSSFGLNHGYKQFCHYLTLHITVYLREYFAIQTIQSHISQQWLSHLLISFVAASEHVNQPMTTYHNLSPPMWEDRENEENTLTGGGSSLTTQTHTNTMGTLAYNRASLNAHYAQNRTRMSNAMRFDRSYAIVVGSKAPNLIANNTSTGGSSGGGGESQTKTNHSSRTHTHTDEKDNSMQPSNLSVPAPHRSSFGTPVITTATAKHRNSASQGQSSGGESVQTSPLPCLIGAPPPPPPLGITSGDTNRDDTLLSNHYWSADESKCDGSIGAATGGPIGLHTGVSSISSRQHKTEKINYDKLFSHSFMKCTLQYFDLSILQTLDTYTNADAPLWETTFYDKLHWYRPCIRELKTLVSQINNAIDDTNNAIV